MNNNITEVVIPLKHLNNFWRTLNILLINCEIELIFLRNCVLADMTAANNLDQNLISKPTGLEFQITSTKVYVPVVTLSKENDKKLLEQLISGFKRIVKWNKYRLQMTVQPQNNNLNYLIGPKFTKVNSLFVLSSATTATGDFRLLYRLLYAILFHIIIYRISV